MPRPGYTTITVRRELAERLEKLRAIKNFSSLSDVIAYLLDRHYTLLKLEAKKKDDIKHLFHKWTRIMDKIMPNMPKQLQQQYLEAKNKLQKELFETSLET